MPQQSAQFVDDNGNPVNADGSPLSTKQAPVSQPPGGFNFNLPQINLPRMSDLQLPSRSGITGADMSAISRLVPEFNLRMPEQFRRLGAGFNETFNQGFEPSGNAPTLPRALGEIAALAAETLTPDYRKIVEAANPPPFHQPFVQMAQNLPYEQMGRAAGSMISGGPLRGLPPPNLMIPITRQVGGIAKRYRENKRKQEEKK